MDRYSSDEDREERREASSSRRSKEERSERRSEKRKSHRRERSKDRYSRYERSRSRSHGRRSRSRSRSRSKRSPRRDYSRHHDSKSKAEKETDKGTTSAESILNPVIFNSGRYAEQIAKRKALFQNCRKPEAAEQEVKNTAIWQSAKFSQDQDGKMTAKFQRLMGIKDNAPKPQEGKVKDMFKKQEELFSSMEMQYEVARATTHTQRGVGLGFGPRHIP